MNIYFCGSIRGGRNDAALYHDMIEFMEQYGTVLTKHVGDPKLTEQGNDGTPNQIWCRDTAWLKESDIVIAECSQPSLGVGYELAFAEALGVPVHVFYGKEDGRLSAMISGNPSFHIVEYHSREALFSELACIFQA